MTPRKNYITIGTAGHIDHGKTALVKALTGIDTDRLQEEKERGITIDLGFAYWSDEITIIDVPGHERFIRNMVAGVTAIDYVMLVIAADDGPMPQTIEHLEILNLLGVEQGVIVLTKTDLAEKDWLTLVESDVHSRVKGSFLEGKPVMKVSSITGEGIDALKKRVFHDLKNLPLERSAGPFRMPVDRSFSIKGFGTVVTGTVLQGAAEIEDPVEILPSGRSVRIRGFQKHNEPADRVEAGDRAAINLAGIDPRQIQRGDVLASKNHFLPTRRMNAKLSLLASATKPLKDRARVRLHTGTSEIMARIRIFGEPLLEPGRSAFVQFQLETPVSAARGDRFVIRRFSPLATLGGGALLDPYATPHKKSDPELVRLFGILESGSASERIMLLVRHHAFVEIDGLHKRLFLDPKAVEKAVQELVDKKSAMKAGRYLVDATAFDRTTGSIQQVLNQCHRERPLDKGLTRTELRNRVVSAAPGIPEQLVDLIIERTLIDGSTKETSGLFSLAGHRAVPDEKQDLLFGSIKKLFNERGFQPPSPEEVCKTFELTPAKADEFLNFMSNQGMLVKLDTKLFFDAGRVREARQLLVDFLAANDNISVSEFREMLGTTRKFGLPLLKYFDEQNVTVRQGDRRILNA